MYLFSEAVSSGGGEMIMSCRKGSDGLPGVYTRLWHLLSLGLASLAGMLPQSPSPSSTHTHTHTHTHTRTHTHTPRSDPYRCFEPLAGPTRLSGPPSQEDHWDVVAWRRACMYEPVGFSACARVHATPLQLATALWTPLKEM